MQMAGDSPVHVIDARLRHLPQKLPGIGRKRFHVPAVTSVKTVSIAKPVLPEPDTPVHTVMRSRGRDIEVFQVVLPRPATVMASVVRPLAAVASPSQASESEKEGRRKVLPGGLSA